MADFLTTLAKRTLNLIPVVQPAIASMFTPAPMIAADFSFHSVPAFEPPEVGENPEERPDSLSQPTALPFSLSNPTQMKSALSANLLTAPSHLSLEDTALLSESGQPVHTGTRESIPQNTPAVSDLQEEFGVSSAAVPRTQLEAIAPTQRSEESALTPVKPLVNAIEEQQQPTDARENRKGEREKGEKSMPRPSLYHINKLLSIKARQDIQVATPDPQQPTVSGASHPQENADRRILPEGGIPEGQAPPGQKRRIDASQTVTNSSSQVLSEPEKPSAATPNLLVGHLEAIHAIAPVPRLSESSLIPVLPQRNRIDLGQQQRNNGGLEPDRVEFQKNLIPSSPYLPDIATKSAIRTDFVEAGSPESLTPKDKLSKPAPTTLNHPGGCYTLTERHAPSFVQESSAADVPDAQVPEATVPSRQIPKPQTTSYFDAQQDIRTSLKQQTENRELAPRSIANVGNSNIEIQPLPTSDHHLLNSVEKLVSETPFEINSLVHRVDADELALVRPLLGSAVLVPDTRFEWSSTGERNLLPQQPLRFAEMRSSASRRLEPRTEREVAAKALDSTPTIQVTIGRIEVRASKSPELSRTRTVRSRPALSLEDYLKQRNGRDE